VSQVYSRSMPALRRVIWQYPPQQFEMVQEWVDAHPEGTPIAVHYHPANHSNAVSGGDRYAAGWTTNAGQLEGAGNRSGELPGAAGDRANRVDAIRRGLTEAVPVQNIAC